MPITEILPPHYCLIFLRDAGTELCLSVCLSVSVSISISVCLCLSLSLSDCLCLYSYLCLSLSLSVCLSVSVSLCLCLCLSLSLALFGLRIRSDNGEGRSAIKVSSARATVRRTQYDLHRGAANPQLRWQDQDKVHFCIDRARSQRITAVSEDRAYAAAKQSVDFIRSTVTVNGG